MPPDTDSMPTGRAAAVIAGTYATDANGEDQTVECGLPIGHYDLSWDGRIDQNVKHKAFWVTCANPPGPIGGGGGIGCISGVRVSTQSYRHVPKRRDLTRWLRLDSAGRSDARRLPSRLTAGSGDGTEA